MKSKANIQTHPIHPLLIPFPIAFLMGTLLFDLLAIITPGKNFWQTGQYLEAAGIISALVTAVPGIIDYKYTVPPQSSAKKRAVKHGLVNTAMLVIFLIAFLLRTDDSSIPVLALEAGGAVLLCIAGWMGGTLVHRNQIGIYNRYANGGKWKEAYLDYQDGPVAIASSDELAEDQMKLIHIGDRRIVLGKTQNKHVAFSDHCSHKGGSLAGGVLICGTVQCPWHGSQFSTYTGDVQAGPAKERISTYPVTETGGKLYITISGETGS